MVGLASPPPHHLLFLGKDFVEATALIKETCPGCRISGGVSNFSFSFRLVAVFPLFTFSFQRERVCEGSNAQCLPLPCYQVGFPQTCPNPQRTLPGLAWTWVS